MFYIEIYDSYISSEDVPILLILQLQVVRRSFYIPKIETKHLASDCSHGVCLYFGWPGGFQTAGGITGLAPSCCRSAVWDAVLVWSGF